MVDNIPIENLEKSNLVILMLNYRANIIRCQVADNDDDFDNESELKIVNIVDLETDIQENHSFLSDDGVVYNAARAVNCDGSFVTFKQWIKNIHNFMK